MQKDQQKTIDNFMRDKLHTAILKQSIRDLASKDIKLRNNAKKFFMSNSFDDFCKTNNFEKSDTIKKGVEMILEYPLISRKVLVNQVAKLLDKNTK